MLRDHDVYALMQNNFFRSKVFSSKLDHFVAFESKCKLTVMYVFLILSSDVEETGVVRKVSGFLDNVSAAAKSNWFPILIIF